MDVLVVVAFFLAGLFEIALPIVLGFWLVKRFRLSWRVFAFGMLFFVLVQVLHIPLVFGTQPSLMAWLGQTGLGETLNFAVLGIFLGILAGLFEEVGRFLVFKHFFKRKNIDLSRKNALLFGAGWGGIEAIAVGGIVLLTMLSYMTVEPLTEQDISDMNVAYGGVLTEEDAVAIKEEVDALVNLKPWEPFLGLAERMMTMALHIAWTLMVLSAVVTGRKRMLWLAIFMHAAVDALAVFIALSYGVVLVEAVLLGFAVVSLLYIKKEWPKARSEKSL